MSQETITREDVRRISVGAWFDPFAAAAITLATFWSLRATAISHVRLILFIILLTSIYYFFSELSRATWTFRKRPRQNFFDILERTITKFLGVLFGIVSIVFAIWLFPAYDNPRSLALLYEAALPFLSFIFPASFFVIFLTEYILGEKRDGTYQFGLLVRGKINEINWRSFLDGVLEWLVRCIFLLINFFSVAYFVPLYRNVTLADFNSNFVAFVMELDGLIFMLILFAILPGYIFASRLIGTDVKKIDHSWFGWTITLAAYPPLNSVVFSSWMQNVPPSAVSRELPVWANLTAEYPLLLYFLGVAIVAMAFIHYWGEAQLGARSAYLSMRGIVTTGAFRITKHPVYVSKCLQWIFIYLPVLNAVGFLNMLQSGLLFLMVCALFAGRALAEEKLLAENPDYVKYALYMDEKGMFAFVGRLLPFMSFKWRYEFWKRNNYLPEAS